MRRPWISLNPQTLAKGFVDRPDYGDPPEDDEERCPTCGRSTEHSEEWSSGQCDDCWTEDHYRED